MNIFVRFSFFGENFYGTQKQKDHPSIQGLFEDLLSKIYDAPVKVTIASRLDRYVNALDFAINFFPPKETITLEHLSYYLRRMLPKDIFLKAVRVVPDDFSARYSPLYKQYLYVIQNQERKNPLFNRFTFVPNKKLNPAKIQEALSLFEGEHDFQYFANREEEKNSHLTLDKTSLEEKEGYLLLRFRAKSFLRYQVRFLVGACLSYEKGKISQETILSLLDGKEVPYPKDKAEPQGLMLEEIHYLLS